jgi:hypothetical protein
LNPAMRFLDRRVRDCCGRHKCVRDFFASEKVLDALLLISLKMTALSGIPPCPW